MYDIVFLSYHEPQADIHYEELKSRLHKVFRVDGVKGIVQAHKKAASLVRTRFFWVVDADSIVHPEFDFSFTWNDYASTDCVAIWNAENPVNGLVYGYGGIKLFPTRKVLDFNGPYLDFTTSIGHVQIMPEVASITKFDTDGFSTWRSAFRECVKLASQKIHNQNTEETETRLHTWRTIGNGDFGGYSLLGANQAYEYVASGGELDKINDFSWLKENYLRVI